MIFLASVLLSASVERCFVSRMQNYSDFFCQKKYPTLIKSHFENTMRNPFFQTPFFLDDTPPPNKLTIVIIQKLIKKLFTESIFAPREVPKLENLQFHFHAFSGCGTSRGQKFIVQTVF